MFSKEITTKNIWINTTLAAGTTLTSDPVDVGILSTDLPISLQVTVVGTGTSIPVDYLVSNDGVNFIRSSKGSVVVSGTAAFHDRMGIGSAGKDLIVFSPILASRLKFVAWNTSTVSNSAITIIAALR